MAKILLILFVVCVVPSIVATRLDNDPFLLQGSAYCDTCRCGYENEVTKYLAGAVVRVECRNRKTDEITYTKDGVTDSSGQYKILIDRDCGDEYCDSVLVKSSDPECAEPDAGRSRARVILTRKNGMSSTTRFANPMGLRYPSMTFQESPVQFVDEFTASTLDRALEELDSLLLRASRNDSATSIQSMKVRVVAAVDALNSLLKTVPAEVLDKGKAMVAAYVNPGEDIAPKASTSS